MIYINGEAVAPVVIFNPTPEHTELDYIQSTGTQYIDTGFIPSSNTRVEITISDVVTDYVILSASTAWKFNIFCLTYQSSDGFRWMPSQEGIRFKKGYNLPKATIELYKLQVKYNDEVISSSTTDINCDYLSTLRVMGDPRITDSNIGASRYRLYSLKVYENEVLQRDYIPVLKEGVPCLYDKVLGVYKYNDGTGDFNYGLKNEVI